MRCTLFTLILSAILVLPAASQQNNLAREGNDAYSTEKSIVETVLGAVVQLVREAAYNPTSDNISSRLFEMSDRLALETGALRVNKGDNDDIKKLLSEIRKDVIVLRENLNDESPSSTNRKLEALEEKIDSAIALVSDPDQSYRPDEWASGETSEEDPDRDDAFEDGEWYSVVDEDDEKHDSDGDYYRKSRRHEGVGIRHNWSTFAGEFSGTWPYRTSALYDTSPSIRYNRVEGVVLGYRKMPLEWDSYERSTIYGNIGYAFALDRFVYELGAETRTKTYASESGIDLKIGASYRKATVTNDAWKVGYSENTLAAFFVNYDYFDYFQVEGWNAYGILRLAPELQVSAGYRSEKYSSLETNVGWSLFGGDHFRPNPQLDSLREDMRSVVVAVEGGRVQDLFRLPTGAAFRGEAEIGDGLGGDFSFRRYFGDIRVYIPTSRQSSLALRGVAGAATGEVPLQKGFTLGGVGSVRAYPHNAFYGTRILAGNAELSVLQDWLFDDWMVSGFVDAGWTNGAGSNEFDAANVFTSAGVGIGLADRALRFEVAWPLSDIGVDKDPQFWIRLSPSF